MKMKKKRMERNLKKNEKRYSSEPEVMLIWYRLLILMEMGLLIIMNF